MPKQGTRVEVNTFVKGLITEASPLNFPANASLDEVNFELNRDGTRSRRLGMDFEIPRMDSSAYPLMQGNEINDAVRTYVWAQVADTNDINFLVVQCGNYLSFHKLGGDSVTVNDFVGRVALDFRKDRKYSFTTANGKLIVASGDTRVACIAYPKANVFDVSYLKIRVRDIWGVEESAQEEADSSLRLGSLSTEHEYNLINQGWGVPRRNKASVLVNPIEQYYADLITYPSNQETVWTGLQYQPVQQGADPFERMYTNLYEDRIGLDLAAAKGYFIIDLDSRGESRTKSMTDNHAKYEQMPVAGKYPADKMETGASVVASYSGRVFYSGFNGEVIDGDARSPSLSDYVFFSKMVKNDSDINACYQEGDPSSRDNNDVLDTDGGFIRVSGAKKIVSLVEVGKYLAVFASNGVWVVSGGSDFGFTGTNYRVDKVTSYGCTSTNSIVEVNGDLLYWGAESIYALGYDKMGTLNAQDFTAASINSYYDQISLDSKKNATGVYDSVNKKIRWLYRSGVPFVEGSYTIELVFDTLLGSFFQHKVEDYAGTALTELFYTSESGVKYLSFYTTETPIHQLLYSLTAYNNTEFRDWKGGDGVGLDAKAYLLTGALTAGDSGIVKQSPYVTLHFRRTETVTDKDGTPLNQSSCLMRCQWEWSNDPKSNKFTSLVETYRYRLAHFTLPGEDYNNGFDTIITKNKLRGRGKALSLYFETSPYKDCQILGWNLTINGNAIT
jgi:hypothetical protein